MSQKLFYCLSTYFLIFSVIKAPNLFDNYVPIEKISNNYIGDIDPSKKNPTSKINNTIEKGIKPDNKHKPAYATQSVPQSVTYWKNLFDEYWNDPLYKMSKTTLHKRGALNAAKSANYEQEYYYLAYHIDGLIQLWQATGDNHYLEECLELIYITIDKARPVKGGYLGWPAKNSPDGFPLWDSYYWRYVATLTRIMCQSPNLLKTENPRGGTYQDDFDTLLSFGEKNIWSRYESYGLNNFYRSRTHMASHWARIALEFYIVTAKTKYKKVFDNISNGKMHKRPSNLRNQLFYEPKNPEAALWDSKWGVEKGSAIQDTSHGGAIVSFWIIAFENNYYWSKKDINSLIITLNDFAWTSMDGEEVKKNIDGTGGYHGPGGRLHEWLNLGRYDRKLQERIKNQYVGKNYKYYATQLFGIAALNEKILIDGEPVYPEKSDL